MHVLLQKIVFFIEKCKKYLHNSIEKCNFAAYFNF